MKNVKIIVTFIFLLTVHCASSQNLFFDVDGLKKRKMDRSLVSKPDFNRLINNANGILKKEIKTVVDKNILPSSKDKHDYYSWATYWWPNPKAKNGLPYVRRDGKPNPSRLKIGDHENLKTLCENVKILSLAYFFTNERKYLSKIENYLDAWFINNSTKMNPHLKHAQAIPGVSNGSVVGTIDTRVLPEMLDALTATGVYKELDRGVYSGLKNWLSLYYTWLVDSDFVKKNLNKINNNVGTAYYMQVISYSQFINVTNNVTDANIEGAIYKLLDVQFTKTGFQTFESGREDASLYTTSNLIYWYNISMMLSKNNIDLWNHGASKGGSLRGAYTHWNNSVNSSKSKSLDNRDLSLMKMSRKIYSEVGESQKLGTSNNFITNLTSPIF